MRGYQKALAAISLAALLIVSAVAVANAQNLKRLGQNRAAAPERKLNAAPVLAGPQPDRPAEGTG